MTKVVTSDALKSGENHLEVKFLYVYRRLAVNDSTKAFLLYTVISHVIIIGLIRHTGSPRHSHLGDVTSALSNLVSPHMKFQYF